MMETKLTSKSENPTGWTLSGLMIAFNLYDAIGKPAKPAAVVEAFAHTGWPIDLAVPLGVILLVCTLIYAIPRTGYWEQSCSRATWAAR